ncbi:hypothetical protein HY605_03870 [Candidatus Peregrinibacteria bacterium]|nr:hypothetical protein [Candidatus Peregrinibacteria bacterium]
MEIILENKGSYPRVGETLQEQFLRKIITQWEKGDKSDKDLHDAQDALTRDVIQEQLNSGVDHPTDGHIRWYDPISHIVRNLKSVEIKGLLRFFDTNFYFRQPVIDGKPQRTVPILLDEFLFAKSISSAAKVVITGPYTLARFSKLEKMDILEATSYLSIIIAKEIDELVRNGARFIQVDEPAILQHPEDYGMLTSAINVIAREKSDARVSLCTYFGNATPFYEKLQQLPVGALHFDITYGDGLVDKILKKGSQKILGLGIVDGRNTRLENVEELAKIVDKVIKKLSPNTIILEPSCGLEYLPRDAARKKLEILKDVRDMLLGKE